MRYVVSLFKFILYQIIYTVGKLYRHIFKLIKNDKTKHNLT